MRQTVSIITACAVAVAGAVSLAPIANAALTGNESVIAAAHSLDLARGAEVQAAPGQRAYSPPPFPAPESLPGLPGGRDLVSELDPAPAYVPQTSCDPKEKPGITRFKQLVLQTYPSGKDWGSSRNCTDDSVSEHLEGRAWDWNVNVKNPTQFAQAAQLLTWLTQDDGYNAKRLGVMYIGYNGRIWGSYRTAEGWRKLSNSNPHTDHVHFSFSWNGAMARTSFWTGTAAAEDYGSCPIYRGQPAPLHRKPNPLRCGSPVAVPPELAKAKLLWQGSRGAVVARVQKKLKVRSEPSFFGKKTAKAVGAFQVRKGLPRTGAVDAQTWYALKLNVPKTKAKSKKRR